jgi:hypothetical protein
VVYTVSSSKDSEQTELKYFCNGASTTVGPNSFVPVEISNDGKYVYGLFKASLCYLKVEKEGEKVSQELIAGSSFGTFGAITGMNVDGDEIVFYTETVENEVSSYTSYMYTVGSEVVQIASGKFYPTPSASEIACPESFVNTYFVCESTEYDEENDRNALSYSTYFLDKKNGALKISDTRGKFSPDGDYFYYANEDYELYRVSLKNTDFQKNTETVFNGVADFEIIKNGDVYIMFEDSKDLGYIFYWDSATKKRSTVSKDADLDSMQLCGSSIYFSETGEDDVTKIYVSTQGSAKEEAGFKGHTPAEALTVKSDVGSKGYAYFVDDNGSGCLYYTSNGKKFSLVASPCIIDGFNDVKTDNTTNSTEGSAATDSSTATEE